MEVDQEEQEGFTAKLNNVKMLQHIFRAINLNDEACFYIKKDGIKMTVEDAKTFQANAFIQSNMFNEFNIGDEDDFAFNISMGTLLECLSIFGISSSGGGGTTFHLNSASMSGGQITSLVMHYAQYGEPLW